MRPDEIPRPSHRPPDDLVLFGLVDPNALRSHGDHLSRVHENAGRVSTEIERGPSCDEATLPDLGQGGSVSSRCSRVYATWCMCTSCCGNGIEMPSLSNSSLMASVRSNFVGQ